MKNPRLLFALALALILTAGVAVPLAPVFTARAAATAIPDVDASPVYPSAKYEYFTAPALIARSQNGTFVYDEGTDGVGGAGELLIYDTNGGFRASRALSDVKHIRAYGNYIAVLTAAALSFYSSPDMLAVRRIDYVGYAAESFCLSESAGETVIYTLAQTGVAGNSAYTVISNKINTSTFIDIPSSVSPYSLTAVAMPTKIEYADGHLVIAAETPDGNGALYKLNLSQSIPQPDLITPSGILAPEGLAASGANVYFTTVQRIYKVDVRSGAGIDAPYSPAALQTAGDLCYFGGRLYLFDTLYKSIDVFSADNPNNFEGFLLASKATASGMFNAPEDFIFQLGKTYVADSYNNRVQIFEGDAVRKINYSFEIPTMVTADAFGNIYVAHSRNKVVKFTPSLEYAETFSPALNEITDMSADALDNLYILDASADADKKLYRKTAAGAAFTEYANVTALNPKRAATVSMREGVYLLCENGVYKFSGEPPSAAPTAPLVALTGADYADFAVDAGENLYLLKTDGTVERYGKAAGETTHTVTYLQTKRNAQVSAGAKHVNINFTEGVLYVSDTPRHCVRKIDCELDIDDGLEPNTDPEGYGRLIRRALAAGDLTKYARAGSEVIARLEKDEKIVVVRYDLGEQNAGYSYCLYVDAARSVAVKGFVRKTLLSEPLPYSAPLFRDGRVYNDFAPVYKYPASWSERFLTDGGENLQLVRDTRITLLDFVPAYDDNAGVRWYMIDVNGTSGFVEAMNVTTRDYEPTTLRPQTNAMIKTNNIGGALLYSKSPSGEYYALPEDKPLPNGKRVTVIGIFDPTAPYTLIRYYNEEYQAVHSAYVETRYVEYYGVDILTVVTVICIILSSAVIITLIIFFKTKVINAPEALKKKLSPSPSPAAA